MKINVTKDSSRREILFEITDGAAPDLDITRNWHKSPRLIRPDSGRLMVINGNVQRITVQGALVLKSGKTSGAIRDKAEWTNTSGAYQERERIENAPEWVQHIWREAASGVTSWTYPEHSSTEPIMRQAAAPNGITVDITEPIDPVYAAQAAELKGRQ